MIDSNDTELSDLEALRAELEVVELQAAAALCLVAVMLPKLDLNKDPDLIEITQALNDNSLSYADRSSVIRMLMVKIAIRHMLEMEDHQDVGRSD